MSSAYVRSCSVHPRHDGRRLSQSFGGVQKRFTSVNLSLFLSKKHPDNEALGEFMSMCVNALGDRDEADQGRRTVWSDKASSRPNPSSRWNSSRSPLLAWVFYEGFGLKEGQKTSYDPVHMDWIFDTPFEFRKRFVQGLADSDGTVRNSVVEVCSVPNAQFTVKVLQSIGMASAHVRKENNQELEQSSQTLMLQDCQSSTNSSRATVTRN